jgi:hypothetical protein
MRNVTLSARPEDIDAARRRAQAEHTTLNEQFRRWLAEYGQRTDPVADFDALMAELQDQVVVGKSFTREERNAR